jgi:type VI protein secretion system component Hcp
MKKLALLLVFLCLGAAVAHASDVITMNTNNQIACSGQSSNTISLLSWSWGVSNSSSVIGTGGVSNPSLSQITLQKSFDDCTDAMLNDLFTGTNLNTVVIAQSRTVYSSSVTIAQVTLTNAFVVSYSVSGASSNSPTEAWSLAFDRICVVTNGLSASGQVVAGTTVCYGG